MEKTVNDTIISGFEYQYDEIGRISSEKMLDRNEEMCYTYDEQSRIVKRETIHLDGTTLLAETFSYDAAGNLTQDNHTAFVYDTNNRLVEHNGAAVSYDLDGNMLSATLNGENATLTFDSGNRLLKAGINEYAYNSENLRIRNLCQNEETIYTHNTNCKLSQLLVSSKNGIITKYVYGLGLIGEETNGSFLTYHFDYRGSTVAITDANGSITDTFAYDTYGKLTSRTGTSNVIFGYNGRDGVVTDKNGLIYMRARYYSPQLRRFINADILPGSIANAVTLNRFAYANGNPVSFVDPFGLSAERGTPSVYEAMLMADHIYTAAEADSIGRWTLIDVVTNSYNNGGLKMGLYASVDLYGKISYAIVNAGSSLSLESVDLAKDTIADWKNNLIQPFGNSTDMKDSINQALKWTSELKNADITFIGHSKGGGEAIANAIATNRNAIAFNPATPRFTKYGLTLRGYTGSITNYIVEGEILNETLTFLHDNVSSLRDEIEFLSRINMKGFNNEYQTVLSLADYIAETCMLEPIGKVVFLPYTGEASSFERHGREILLELIEENYN